MPLLFCPLAFGRQECRCELNTLLSRCSPNRPQVADILGRMGDSRQVLLFSATMPGSLADFAAARLQQPQLVRLDVERRISPDLALAFFTVRVSPPEWASCRRPAARHGTHPGVPASHHQWTERP